MKGQKAIIRKGCFLGYLFVCLMTFSGRGWAGMDFTCLAPQQVDYYETCRLPERPALPERPTEPALPQRPTEPALPAAAEAPAGRPIRPIPSDMPRPERPTEPALPPRPSQPAALQLRGQIPTCNCPDPQQVPVGEICSDKLYDLPCLHRQQAAELREQGVSFETVELSDGGIGYRITTIVTGRSAACTGEGRKVLAVTPTQELEGVPEIACRFTLPECPCEEPEIPSEMPSEMPSEIPPEEPEEEVTEEPPAPVAPPQVLEPEPSPQIEAPDEVFLCRSGMPFAIGTRSGVEISIVDCPHLPAGLAVEEFHVALTRGFEKYLNDRQPGQLDAIRTKAEAILRGWKQRQPGYQIYPIVAAQIVSEEVETAAAEAEPLEIISIAPEEMEIVEPSEEGRGPVFHVNVPQEEDRRRGGPSEGPVGPDGDGLPPQAQGRGPQAGPRAAAMTLATSDDSYGSRAVIIVPSEYLNSQGGGCSLVREPGI